MGKVVVNGNHQALVESNNFKLYCEFYGLCENEAMLREETLAYIEAHQALLDQMIGGYGSMGVINHDICENYLGCECGNFDNGILEI